MATTRTASVHWEGSLMEGRGEVSLTSSDVDSYPVTWPARAEAANGLTTPEELLAAAHSTCFSMALSQCPCPGRDSTHGRRHHCRCDVPAGHRDHRHRARRDRHRPRPHGGAVPDGSGGRQGGVSRQSGPCRRPDHLNRDAADLAGSGANRRLPSRRAAPRPQRAARCRRTGAARRDVSVAFGAAVGTSRRGAPFRRVRFLGRLGSRHCPATSQTLHRRGAMMEP